MKKFSLNKLSKSQLKDEELNALKGGSDAEPRPTCGCKCACNEYHDPKNLELHPYNRLGMRNGSMSGSMKFESGPYVDR